MRDQRKSRTPVCRVLVLTAALLLMLPASDAVAGRLLVTGHDADLHCSEGEQCGFVKTATDYVRAGAPDPAKPVLVLDRGALQLVTALDRAYGRGVVPRTVVDPRSPGFKTLPLSPSIFSAILVASDTTCGGCDLNTPTSTPDSDAIAARAGDIKAFYNAGGGIYANSGGTHGDGDPENGLDRYYAFVPIGIGGRIVTPPFCLTALGSSIGFQDAVTVGGCPLASRRTGTRDDINCCGTHNSFADPARTSALKVAEHDLGQDGVVSGDDRPETLVADGQILGDAILPPPVLGKQVNLARVRGRVFIKLRRGSGGQARASGTKGTGFVPLREPRQIPVGTLVDTRRGEVELLSAGDRSAKSVLSGRFARGLFQVIQSRRARAKGLTELRLKGSSFAACGRVRGRASAAGRRSRRIRRLRGSASGRFRTRGRHSAATVRGTIWTVTDRCDGTLTSVKRGRVAVRDFRRRKTITVRAGKSYLARARR